MSQVITRNDIIDILKKWESDQLTIQNVQKWAEERHCDVNDNFEYADNDDAIVEVMSNLASAHLNLVIKDDISAYTNFLKVPFQDFDSGYDDFAAYHNSIDYEDRISKIEKIPFYAKGCKVKLYAVYE